MDDDKLIRTVTSPARRVAEYRRMVIAYYDRVTDAYRERWGDSFHLPVWAGDGEDPIAGIERRVARVAAIGPDALVLDVGCGIGGDAEAGQAYWRPLRRRKPRARAGRDRT